MYRFADHIHPSMGKMLIKSPVLEGHKAHIRILIDVVEAYIPMIFGPSYLRKHNLLVDYIDMFIISKVSRWLFQLEYKLCHMFWSWEVRSVDISGIQVIELHQQFFQLSPDKLINVVKRASTFRRCHYQTRDISAYSEMCNVLGRPPFLFRA